MYWLYVMFSLLSSYLTISYLLLKHPSFNLVNSLPKIAKYKKMKSLVHGSHRGGSLEGIENTMAAFENAVKKETQLLEVDCYLTSDNQVVVVHDNHLNRLCNSNKVVTETEYSSLPTLINNPLLPPPFHGKNNFLNKNVVYNEKDRKIPLLEELFIKYPNININIDCKHESLILAQSVVNLIKKYKREDRTIVGAFSNKTTQMIRLQSNDIHTIFSAKESLMLIIYYITGVLPFVKLNATFLELPLAGELFEHIFEDLLEDVSGWRLTAARFAYTIAENLLRSKSFYKHLQDRGVHVIFWVANSDADFKLALMDLGADGVMTDAPSKLTTFLDENIKDWKNL